MGLSGRRDILDLDAKLSGLALTARKLNDVAPPSGFARFLASDDVNDVVTSVDFNAGAATLWTANDAVEYRAPGDRARQRSTTWASENGTSGASPATLGASVSFRLNASSASESAMCGGRPVSASNRVAPTP